MNTTLIRAITALTALGSLILSYYFFATNGLITAISVVILGAQHEYYKMNLSQFDKGPWILLYIIACIGTPVISTLQSSQLGIYFTISFMVIVAGLLPTIRSNEDRERLQVHASHMIIGFVYVGLLPSFALKILSLEHGTAIFSLALLSVFATDTLAYFTGPLLKGKKLQEYVSPHKTWSGAWGGLVGSIAITSLVCYLFTPELFSPLFPIIVLLASFFSQVGDLFESLIKRNAEVKDSGSLLPGHGGILDRIDGLLFALPVFYFAFYFF